MKEIDAGDYWCPMGRISLQKGSNQPKIEVVPGGAFNTAIIFAPNSSAHGATRYPSVCIGRQCAMWKKGFFSNLGIVPDRAMCGRCGLRVPDYGGLICTLGIIALAAYVLIQLPILAR